MLCMIGHSALQANRLRLNTPVARHATGAVAGLCYHPRPSCARSSAMRPSLLLRLPRSARPAADSSATRPPRPRRPLPHSHRQPRPARHSDAHPTPRPTPTATPTRTPHADAHPNAAVPPSSTPVLPPAPPPGPAFPPPHQRRRRHRILHRVLSSTSLPRVLRHGLSASRWRWDTLFTITVRLTTSPISTTPSASRSKSTRRTALADRSGYLYWDGHSGSSPGPPTSFTFGDPVAERYSITVEASNEAQPAGVTVAAGSFTIR
jgi:hypothetical protein